MAVAVPSSRKLKIVLELYELVPYYNGQMIEYQQHEIGKCYPSLSEDELAKLEESIREDGPSPIMLFEEQVLDGWHQYKSCQKLKVAPIFQAVDPDDPIQFVIRRNEGRRHLSIAARTEIAIKLANCQWGGNRKSIKSSIEDLKNPHPKTRAKIASDLGINRSHIDKLKLIKKNATPEVIEAVKNSQIGISTGYAIQRLAKGDQVAALAKAKSRKSGKASKSKIRKQSSSAVSPFDTPEYKAIETEALAKINAPSIYPEDAVLPIHPSGKINTDFIQNSIRELRKNEPHIGKMTVRQMFNDTIWPYTQAIQTYAFDPPPSNALCGQIDPRLVKWARNVACKVRERQLLLFKRNQLRNPGKSLSLQGSSSSQFKSNGKKKNSKNTLEELLKALKKLLQESHFALDDRELVTEQIAAVVKTYFEERWASYARGADLNQAGATTDQGIRSTFAPSQKEK
jgi:hypothetical protein